DGVLPRSQGLLLVVDGPNVGVEGVHGPRIDLDLVGDVGRLESRLQLIPVGIGKVVGVGRVDAQHGGLDVFHLVHRRRRAIERYGGFEAGADLFGCPPGDAAAEAEAIHADGALLDVVHLGPVLGGGLEVANVAVDVVGARQD